MTNEGPLLLAGGGHSHALVLKRWAMHPQHRPRGEVVLINRHSTAFYSGMVPGLIAGDYVREFVPELAHLCDADIHDPPDGERGNYPARIVEHREARERALTAYRDSRGE